MRLRRFRNPNVSSPPRHSGHPRRIWRSCRLAAERELERGFARPASPRGPVRRRTRTPSVVIFALKSAPRAATKLEELHTGSSDFIELARTREQAGHRRVSPVFSARRRSLLTGALSRMLTQTRTRRPRRSSALGIGHWNRSNMIDHMQVGRDRLPRAESWLARVTPPDFQLCGTQPFSWFPARLRLAQGRAEQAAGDALDAGRVLAPYATRGVHVVPLSSPGDLRRQRRWPLRSVWRRHANSPPRKLTSRADWARAARSASRSRRCRSLRRASGGCTPPTSRCRYWQHRLRAWNAPGRCAP